MSLNLEHAPIRWLPIFHCDLRHLGKKVNKVRDKGKISIWRAQKKERHYFSEGNSTFPLFLGQKNFYWRHLVCRTLPIHTQIATYRHRTCVVTIFFPSFPRKSDSCCLFPAFPFQWDFWLALEFLVFAWCFHLLSYIPASDSLNGRWGVALHTHTHIC